MAIIVGTEVSWATRWRGSLDVPARREMRQQHDGVAVAEGRLAHSKTVHVVERRRDQEAVAERARPPHALTHRPQV